MSANTIAAINPATATTITAREITRTAPRLDTAYHPPVAKTRSARTARITDAKCWTTPMSSSARAPARASSATTAATRSIAVGRAISLSGISPPKPIMLRIVIHRLCCPLPPAVARLGLVQLPGTCELSVP